MMMGEQVKRFLSMIFESLIASAMRLARVAAIRAELESYTALFEEAKALEQSGQTRLAEHLRSEVSAILNDSSLPAAGPEPHGGHAPFALESPSETEPLPTIEGRQAIEAEEEGPPRRRRGRPRALKENDKATEAMKNGQQLAAAKPHPELPLPSEPMSELEEGATKSEKTIAKECEAKMPQEMSFEEHLS